MSGPGRLWTLVVVLALTSLPAAARAADDVTLALDWVVNGSHAGYFAALDKGYYGEAGLTVTIVRGYGSGDTIKRLATGGATFGIADTGTLITAKGNADDEIPVRIVAMEYADASVGIIYVKESGIKTPKDLEGRKIARSAGGASVNLFGPWLEVNKVDRSKITEVVVDGANFLPLLLQRRVDAIINQSKNLPQFQIPARQAGLTVGAMTYSEYGYPTYGNAVLAPDKLIQKNPDLVRRFVAATLKGFRFGYANPEEGVALIRKRHPEVEAEIGKQTLLETKKLVMVDDVRKHGLGYFSVERLTRTRDIVARALALKHPVPVERLYAAGFLPREPILPAD